MSLQLVIPWRVALQQSSPPLHQPTEILNEKWLFEKENLLTASVPIENCLNRGVHPNPVCQQCANPEKLSDTLRHKETIEWWERLNESADGAIDKN
jgi:hypothetical protein